MTATDYAHSVEKTPEAFEWRDLERSAFEPYPSLPPLFDALLAHIDGQKISRARSWLGVLGGLFIVVMTIAPMITAGILIGGMRLDTNAGVSLAWAGLIALCHIAFRGREWARASRRAEPPARAQTLFAGVNVFFSALTAAMAFVLADGAFPPTGAWWYVALFVVMTLACAASVIIMVVRSRAAARGDLEFSPSPESALISGVEALTTAQQDAIRADLATAIELLSEAGAISGSERASALSQTLGNLTRSRWTAARLYGGLSAPQDAH